MAIFISIPYKQQLLALTYTENELFILENELEDIEQVIFLIEKHNELIIHFTPPQLTELLRINQSCDLLMAGISLIKKTAIPAEKLFPWLSSSIGRLDKLSVINFLSRKLIGLIEYSTLSYEQIFRICSVDNAVTRLKFVIDYAKYCTPKPFNTNDFVDVLIDNLGFANLKKYLENLAGLKDLPSKDLKAVFLKSNKLESIIRYHEFIGGMLSSIELLQLLHFRKFSKSELACFLNYLERLVHMGFEKSKLLEIYYSAQEPSVFSQLLELAPCLVNLGFSLAEIAHLANFMNGAIYLRMIIGSQCLWQAADYQLLTPSHLTSIIIQNRAQDTLSVFLEQLAYLKQFLNVSKIIQLAQHSSGVAYLKLLAEKIQLLIEAGISEASIVQAVHTPKLDQILNFLLANHQKIKKYTIPEKELVDLIQGQIKTWGQHDEPRILNKILAFIIHIGEHRPQLVTSTLTYMVRHRDQNSLEKYLNFTEALLFNGFNLEEINSIIKPEYSNPNIKLFIRLHHCLLHIGMTHQLIMERIASKDGFMSTVSLIKSLDAIQTKIPLNLVKPLFSNFIVDEYPQIAASFYLTLEKEIGLIPASSQANSLIPPYKCLKMVDSSKSEILKNLHSSLLKVNPPKKSELRTRQFSYQVRRLVHLGLSIEQIHYLERLDKGVEVLETISSYGQYLHELQLNSLQIIAFFQKKITSDLQAFPFEQLSKLNKTPYCLSGDQIYQVMMADDLSSLLARIEKYFSHFQCLGYDKDDCLKLLRIEHIDSTIDELYKILPQLLHQQLSFEDIYVLAFISTSTQQLTNIKLIIDYLVLMNIDKNQLIQLIMGNRSLNYERLVTYFPLFRGLDVSLSRMIEVIAQDNVIEQIQQIYLKQHFSLEPEQIQQILELPQGSLVLDNLYHLGLSFKAIGFNDEQVITLFIKHHDTEFLKPLIANISCFFVAPYCLNPTQVKQILLADNYGYCISVTTLYFPQWQSLGLRAANFLKFIINKDNLLAIAEELHSCVPVFLKAKFSFDDLFAMGEWISVAGTFSQLFYTQSLMGVLGFTPKDLVATFIASKGQLDLDKLCAKLPLFNGLGFSIEVALQWMNSYPDETELSARLDTYKLAQFGLCARQIKQLQAIPDAAIVIENLMTIGFQFKSHQFSMDEILSIFQKYLDLSFLLSITSTYFKFLNSPYHFSPSQLHDVLMADNGQLCLDLASSYFERLSCYGLKSGQFMALSLNHINAQMMIEEVVNTLPYFLENNISIDEFWAMASFVKEVGVLSKLLSVYKVLMRHGIDKQQLIDAFCSSQGQLPLELIYKKLPIFRAYDISLKEILDLLAESPTDKALKQTLQAGQVQLGKRTISEFGLFSAMDNHQSRRPSSYEFRLE